MFDEWDPAVPMPHGFDSAGHGLFVTGPTAIHVNDFRAILVA